MSGLASSVRVWGRHAWLATRMWYFGAHFINWEFKSIQSGVRMHFICRSSCLSTVWEHLSFRVLALECVWDDQTDHAFNGNAFELWLLWGYIQAAIVSVFWMFFLVFFGNLSGRPCLVGNEVCGSSVVNTVGWGVFCSKTWAFSISWREAFNTNLIHLSAV